jgi:Tfp pilus assembly protein PilF
LASQELNVPTWADFDERPAAELQLRSPAAEIAAVLQRSRADLDTAARAGAESRAEGLRALAEQAVLAVELEKVLDGHVAACRDDAALQRLHPALAAVKDRMLAEIAAAGLEVVRSRGDVDELEVGVRLDGMPLRPVRAGRGARGVPVTSRALASFQPAPAPAAAGRITCPVVSCGAENDADAEVCVGCLTQLAGYIRLSLHPHVLFNRGLQAARAGDSASARECFAAVVLWQSDDIGTRNAYALACLEAHDRPAARRAWEEVLARAPGDAVALRGLSALARMERSGGD